MDGGEWGSIEKVGVLEVRAWWDFINTSGLL